MQHSNPALSRSELRKRGRQRFAAAVVPSSLASGVGVSASLCPDGLFTTEDDEINRCTCTTNLPVHLTACSPPINWPKFASVPFLERKKPCSHEEKPHFRPHPPNSATDRDYPTGSGSEIAELHICKVAAAGFPEPVRWLKF